MTDGAPEVGVAAAFAPAHITGFFEIHDGDRDIARRGSRGAGLSLDAGAATVARVRQASQQTVRLFLNGEHAEGARTTLATVKELVGESAIDIEFRTELAFPQRQGLGMSAAGVLSQALALAKLTGLARADAVHAAHAAEVIHRTGLGDVLAAATGGVEIRSEPGLPPWGIMQNVIAGGNIVVCVLDETGIETATVLRDPARRRVVNAAGAAALAEVLKRPNLESIFRASRVFAEKVGLGSPAMRDAFDAIGDAGLATQCMIGNSVFAYGETPDLVRILRSFGEVSVAEIDPRGARLLTVEGPQAGKAG